jgi:hypothetical protein
MKKKTQSKDKIKNIIFWIISFFIIVLIILFIYQVILIFFKKKEIILLKASKPCRIQKEICEVDLPSSKKLYVELIPRPLKMGQPGELTVKLEDEDFVPKFVNFDSLDMDMGYNLFNFQKVEDRVYKANFSLSICTEEVMKWKGLILLEDGQKYGVEFFFTVQK